MRHSGGALELLLETTFDPEEHRERAEAARALASDYLDLYTSSTGVHHDIAAALFHELAAWLDDGAPAKARRGFSRDGLAKKAGIQLSGADGEERRKKLSILDKALRTLAQNLQIFGHRPSELPEGTKRSRWLLDEAAVKQVGGVVEERCIFQVGGDAQILGLKGPMAAARGDTDVGRYFFLATFQPMRADLVVEFDAFLREIFYMAVTDSWVTKFDAFLLRVRELLANPIARKYGSSARAECLKLLRSFERLRDEAHAEIRNGTEREAQGGKYPLRRFDEARLRFIEHVLEAFAVPEK